MPKGLKKGMVALDVPLVDVVLPFEVGDGIKLESGPGPLSEFWIKGLGEWKVEAFHGRSLVISCTAESDQVEILDDEHAALINRAWDFAGALLICGLRMNSAPISLSRSLSDDEDSLRQYAEQAVWQETGGIPPSVLNEQMLNDAKSVFAGLQQVARSPGQFQRFRKGYHSIFAGMAQRSCDDRAYHFARALEALHATSRGEGERVFVEKCCALCGPSGANDSMFRDLFAIRNNVVHVNPFADLAKDGESLAETEARVVRTCADAELVAKEVYRRVLSDEALLECFVDDASTRSLWNAGFTLGDAVCPEQLRARREQVVEEWEVRTYV